MKISEDQDDENDTQVANQDPMKQRQIETLFSCKRWSPSSLPDTSTDCVHMHSLKWLTEYKFFISPCAVRITVV